MSPDGTIEVLVTKRFTEAQLNRIRSVSPSVRVSYAAPDQADYSNADVLYADNVPTEIVQHPRLKWVQLHLAGINALYGHPIYTDESVTLTTTSGVHSTAVADYTIAVLLALTHRIPTMIEWQAKEVWPPDDQRWPLFVPSEIRGGTLGIIGYGSIGREIARIAKAAFSMRVLACKRSPERRSDPGYHPPGTGDPQGILPDEWYSPAELHGLLTQSDVVVMSAPLTPDTVNMIGETELRAMRPSAYFINVGRGATVDEAALTRALQEQWIAGAAVDVFKDEPPAPHHPFFSLENMIASPHVSGFLATYDDGCAELFAENLRRYIAGEELLNVVDRTIGY